MSKTDNQKKSRQTEHKPDCEENSEQLVAQEIGGRKGPEPTRYGDWEKNGRCIDF